MRLASKQEENDEHTCDLASDAARTAGMTRREVVAMLAIAGAVPLTGCGSFFPAKYRFRMTVEVDTPEGVKSGSSVMEVSSHVQSIPGKGGPTADVDLTGEAAAVDLPDGGTLFALLTEGLAGHVTRLFEPNFDSERNADMHAEQFVAAVRKLSGRDQRGRSFVLPAPAYPQLVTFRDISDPKSVAAVDPANLAVSLSAGVKLRRITVTITDDDVTTGIDERLTWLNHLENYRKDPSNPFTNFLPSQIGDLRRQAR